MTTVIKHQPQNTRKMLEQRIAAIEEFLAVRLGLIRKVRASRDAELLWYELEEKRIAKLCQAAAHKHATNEKHCLDIIEECAQQIAEAEARQDMAASKLAEGASAYQDAQSALGRERLRHQKRSEPLRSKWRQQLKLFQDGLVRRKRHERAKLARRLADKQAKAEARKGRKRLTAEEIAMGDLP